MIVCVCNRLTEHEVREAAAKGARTPEAAFHKLGCEPQCGCCLDYAQEIIDDEHRSCAGGTARRAVAQRPQLRAVA
jgi:bacterioferritin-associated ferredoxin